MRGSKGDVPLPGQAMQWMTPNVPNGGRSASHAEIIGRTAMHNGKKVQIGLEHQAKTWPTPAAQDYKGANSADHVTTNGSGRMHMGQLPNFVEHGSHCARRDQRIPDGPKSLASPRSLNPRPTRRSLNPYFVEWLMNWPKGWTEMTTQTGDPVKHCAACGKQLSRKRFGARLECRGVFLRRRYCDRSCMAAGQTKEDASRSAIQKRYAHLKRNACEHCGSSESLQLHHRDRNWRNNQPSNLETLCASCHMRHHHSHGDITEKKPKPPCAVCGKPSYRASEQLCNTCQTKQRRGKLTVGSIDFESSETVSIQWWQLMRGYVSTLVTARIEAEPQERLL